jgi:VWFA-related protein
MAKHASLRLPSCKLNRRTGILRYPSNPRSWYIKDGMNPFYFPAAVCNRARRTTLLLSVVTLLIVIPAGLSAQTPDDVIKTDTALVQLNVGVVDKQGNAITSLSRNDFAIYEDGVRRPILSFEPTEAPFSLVLLLDMSGSTVNFRQQIRGAALRFLDALSPEDRVSVIEFSGKGVKSLLGFSTDRRRIAYAITDLANGAGETPLYEALKYSLKELAHEGKRRKAIVALTDGLDTEVRNGDRAIVANASSAEVGKAIKPETQSQLVSVLNQADREGATIFPLALPSGDPKRLPLPDPLITAMYEAAHTRLQLLADRTGGRLHEIHRLDDLARLYAQVAADLRTLYTIAYQPPNPGNHDGKWREIRVEIARADLVASTKPGYYAR